MTMPSPVLSWSDANQQLLVAEFARLRQRLAADPSRQSEPAAAQLAAGVDAARAAMPSPSAIDALSASFGLSHFERDVLLLCAGVEMDADLAAQCATARGDARRPGPTFALTLATFDEPHWSALTPIRPLRQWRLLDVDAGQGGGIGGGLAQSMLRIDERVLHYLAGVNYLDIRLRSLVQAVASPTVMAPSHRDACDRVCAWIQQTTPGDDALVQLIGDDPLAHEDVAAAIASKLGRSLHALRAEDVPVGHEEREAFATLWHREAVLLGSALLVVCEDDALPRQARRLMEQLHGLVLVGARTPQSFSRSSMPVIVNKPGAVEQKQLWTQALGERAARLNGALDGVASQFTLSARRIQQEGSRLAPALTSSVEPDRLVWSACRSMGRLKLDELAQRLDLSATWEDLILPEEQKAALREIVSHVRNRLTVYRKWGFAGKGTRGLGISALFAGESGTGKTMAGEVIGSELQLDVYRIDLSAVVSKYIGETEKNLRRLFDAAEESGAILLFDEADALFGKRSEVKDSHDRYANIEVSYLLQRMESYRGLAILTSNLKASLDVAFQRRLRFVVQFPFPDAVQREAIWRRVFPSETPCEAVDYGKLARLSVAGGSIRNIALNAAFSAAESGNAVTMTHLLRAAHLEAGKRERPLSDAETRGWV